MSGYAEIRDLAPCVDAAIDCLIIMLLGVSERLSPYEIRAPIRTGETGEVYKARATRLEDYQRWAATMTIEEAMNLRTREGR